MKCLKIEIQDNNNHRIYSKIKKNELSYFSNMNNYDDDENKQLFREAIGAQRANYQMGRTDGQSNL